VPNSEDEHINDAIQGCSSYQLINIVNKYANDGSQQVHVSAVLSWSEYFNGKWQKPRTSDSSAPIYLTTLSAHDASFYKPEHTVLNADPSDSARLILQIGYFSGFPTGSHWFELSSTSGALTAIKEVKDTRETYWERESGLNTLQMQFNVNYRWKTPNDNRTKSHRLTKYPGVVFFFQHQKRSGLGEGYWSDSWGSPFLWQDGRASFFVQPTPVSLTLAGWSGYGVESLATSPLMDLSSKAFEPVDSRTPLEELTYRLNGIPSYTNSDPQR
jgi:hypothetical protein